MGAAQKRGEKSRWRQEKGGKGRKKLREVGWYDGKEGRRDRRRG